MFRRRIGGVVGVVVVYGLGERAKKNSRSNPCFHREAKKISQKKKNLLLDNNKG
jgi:hypothetical protein